MEELEAGAATLETDTQSRWKAAADYTSIRQVFRSSSMMNA
jgi:hypothetical protein